MQKFWIFDKIYKKGVWVAVGPQDKVAHWAKKELKFDFPARPDAAGMLVTHVSEDETWKVKVLWLPTWKGKVADYATLSHECVHLAVRNLYEVGVDIGMPKAEELCYLHEFFFSEILQRLKKS